MENTTTMTDKSFYVRTSPWEHIGTRVEEAPNSAEALRIAGLDWHVEQKQVFTSDNILIPGYKANVRDADNKILGIVTDRYKIVQNDEAFAFTDSIIGGDVHYEAAGSFKNGRSVWLLAQLPETKIIGETYVPYLCFLNSFDGTGSIKVSLSPIRTICSNMIAITLKKAVRSWSIRHMGNIEDKMEEARMCLEMSDVYMKELNAQSDIYANTDVSEDQVQKLLNILFPANADSSEREKRTVQDMRDNFINCYYADDIKQFRGTAYGIMQASTDLASHMSPVRNTKNFAENNFQRLLSGHPIVDNTVSFLNEIVAA